MKKIAALIVLLIPALLLSNPLPLGGPGKTIVPYISKSGSISLDEERISIAVGETEEIPGFALNSKMKIKCVSFNCAYYLHNTGQAQTITIGFPFYSGRTTAGQEYGQVTDFKVFVDDVRLDSVREQSKPMNEVIIFKDRITGAIDDNLIAILRNKKQILDVPGQPEMCDFSPLGHTLGAIGSNLNTIKYNKNQKALLLDIIKEQVEKGDMSFAMYRNWYYFPVEFKAGATRKLVITYHSSNGNFPDRSFYYVLRSARLWNGPIGKCIVEIKFLDKNSGTYDISPKAYTSAGPHAVRFEWNDFVPSEDIFVRFKDKGD